MLVADRHELARASGDRLSDDRFRVVDDIPVMLLEQAEKF